MHARRGAYVGNWVTMYNGEVSSCRRFERMMETPKHVPTPLDPSGKPLALDQGTFMSAPKFYAQNAIVTITGEEAMLQFCLRQDVAREQDGAEVALLLTQAVVYLSLSHARRLHEVLGTQLGEVERLLTEISAATGLPSPDEIRQKLEGGQKE